MGFAVDLASALTETEAGELTAEGLERMFIDAGWIDPTAGIEAIRKALEIPTPNQ